MLVRARISKLVGRALPKAKFRLVGVLTKRENDSEESGRDRDERTGGDREETSEGDNDQAPLEVAVPTDEEGREVSWWGIESGDTIRVQPL